MPPIDDWRKELYSLLSHDLRTPIRNIQTFAEILCKQPLSEQQIKEIAANLIASAEEQQYILEHALDLLRIDHEQPFDNTPSSLTLLINQAVENITPLAQTQNISIATHLLYDGFTHTPAQLISQVLQNLLTNAIRSSSPGATITIKIRRQWGTLLIDIIDTGMGFDPKLEESLFERFNGLGLYLNRKLIRQYQGDLSAHSAGAGMGATFTLCLPPSDDPTTIQ